jgi:hypothetical protein
MRVALRTLPLFVIGFTLIGCGKDSGGGSVQPQARVNPQPAKAYPGLPTVTLKIPGMF